MLDVDSLIPRISQESLSSVLPREAAATLVRDLRGGGEETPFLAANKALIEELLTSAEKRLREEKRSVAQILGEANSGRLLSLVEQLDVYDSDAVKVFLGSGVFEKMLGEILYDAIFEFLKRADIVGNVVNNMPLVGPIRQAITKELKNVLDLVLGPQVKTFLASYSRVAVQRMIAFLLREDNKKNLMRANRSLAEALLKRTPAELLPASSDLTGARQKLWAALQGVTAEDLTRLVDLVYSQLGETSVGEVLELGLLLEASPQARSTAQAILDRYVPGDKLVL
jgi:hypothetical protein